MDASTKAKNVETGRKLVRCFKFFSMCSFKTVYIK